MTTIELTKLTGLSKQRIAQLRNSKAKNGIKLIEGKDWYWERGKIVYTISAVNKLNKRSGK